MALKPGGGLCGIKEQIVVDPVSGLTLQFALMPESDAPIRLRIFGDLDHGNRELLFDQNGTEVGAGTHFGDLPRASWLREVTS